MHRQMETVYLELTVTCGTAHSYTQRGHHDWRNRQLEMTVIWWTADRDVGPHELVYREMRTKIAPHVPHELMDREKVLLELMQQLISLELMAICRTAHRGMGPYQTTFLCKTARREMGPPFHKEILQ